MTREHGSNEISLSELQDRLARARRVVADLERAIDARQKADAASRAAMRSLALFASGDDALVDRSTESAPDRQGAQARGESPQQAPESGDRSRRVAQSPRRRYEALNPGRSWTREIWNILKAHGRAGATLDEVVGGLSGAGMSFGKHHPNGMTSTKLIAGERTGHFRKLDNDRWACASESLDPPKTLPINEDGRSWAACISEVLDAAPGRLHSVKEIVKALESSGRQFGAASPTHTVRSVLRRLADREGWVKEGSKWMIQKP